MRAYINSIRIVVQQILLKLTCIVGGENLARLIEKLIRHLELRATQRDRQGPIHDHVPIAIYIGGNALCFKPRTNNIRFPGVKVTSDRNEHKFKC